jgi:hypothetical protein
VTLTDTAQELNPPSLCSLGSFIQECLQHTLPLPLPSGAVPTRQTLSWQSDRHLEPPFVVCQHTRLAFANKTLASNSTNFIIVVTRPGSINRFSKALHSSLPSL